VWGGRSANNSGLRSLKEVIVYLKKKIISFLFNDEPRNYYKQFKKGEVKR